MELQFRAVDIIRDIPSYSTIAIAYNIQRIEIRMHLILIYSEQLRVTHQIIFSLIGIIITNYLIGFIEGCDIQLLINRHLITRIQNMRIRISDFLDFLNWMFPRMAHVTRNSNRVNFSIHFHI